MNREAGEKVQLSQVEERSCLKRSLAGLKARPLHTTGKGKESFEGLNYGSDGGVGGLHYATKAGVAESDGSDGTDGHNRCFARQIRNGAEHRAALAGVPIKKIANGGRAEK